MTSIASRRWRAWLAAALLLGGWGAFKLPLERALGAEVSQAIADMPPKPSSARVSPSKNSASRPPRPLPRTVTVVSPPEMMATGGSKGWP